ncbi:MAG TPA: DNA starvation/stationary phase protection protein [Ktedonobacteraceae bacterium]|jgi:starvation-inducible DNA-binding protein|nr:DNA starvation/stationary phase protection protein [Ktedonobacteraceae bacterium]
MTTRQATKTQSNGKVKIFPAPTQLATPTDLTSQESQAITEALNPLVADLFALYVKTKNFHWHLSGSHFRDYHLLFDEQARQIFGAVDTLAERVRRIGGTTIRSISHISQLQTIEDDNSEFVPPGEMARRLMEDNAHLAKKQREAHQVCVRCRDIATASQLEIIIDESERRKWFLFEIVQGLNNTD